MKKRYYWLILLLVSFAIVTFAAWNLYYSIYRDLRPNILIITMDTTRADHLNCYGHSQIKTPNIDALANHGILFEEVFSVQPVTLPSHCSIFTGKYPFNHGVRDNSIYRLGDEQSTLAEILREEGYVTAAFVSSYILDKQFGLDQGFMLYNDRFLKPKQKGRLPVDRRASEVSILACKWFEENKDFLDTKPFFLWLHYYDPHADYDPPSPYREAYPNPYDGEIAYTDEWIGYVIDELKLRHLLSNTLIILVADHGESLGEYGEQTHGIFIYRPTTHVPLIVHYPKKLPSGKRIQHRVSTIDILPTLLDIVNIPILSKCDGQSLRPLINGEEAVEEVPIYSETYIPRSFNWSELKGIRNGDIFYIEAPIPELLVLKNDENEVENIIENNPKQARFQHARLAGMLAEAPKQKADSIAIDQITEARLKALGYFIGGALNGDEEDASRPDPKQKVHLFNKQQRANNMIQNGQFEKAIELYTTIIEEDPNNTRFLLEFADVLIDREKTEDAKIHILHALELNRNAHTFYMLGLCYEKEGDADAAREAFSNTVRIDKDHFLSQYHLGILAINSEKWEEAANAFREAQRIRKQNPAVLNNLGYIAIKAHKDYDKGIKLIEKALELDHENPLLLSSLGWAHYNNGNLEKAKEYLETALALIPDNPMFIDQLIQVYDALNDTENLQKLHNRKKLLRELRISRDRRIFVLHYFAGFVRMTLSV